MPLDLPPTREAGLERLGAFVPRAGRSYAERRGHDLPEEGQPHVSILSPYLRHRMVTEEEVLRAVAGAHPDGADTFVSEVFWRTYFKGFLEMRPGLWTAYLAGLARARDRLATEAGLRRAWEDACSGRTGIEPFDAWAHGLREAGYLHNHARMWMASVWCFTLRLPWELGADLFMRHLLDGDPASNTLSWRWVAGLHTPGKIYLATASNIARHSGGRFGTDVRLAAAATPVEGAPNPPPVPAPRPRAWRASEATGLLLHEDDLHPEFVLTRLRPRATALTCAAADRSPMEAAPAVAGFARAALADCDRRLALGAAGPLEDADAIAAWARGHDLDQVVTPFAPVGPVAGRLDRAERRLAEDGVALIRVLRPFDGDAWPHATHGYFRFKRAIPALLGGVLAA